MLEGWAKAKPPLLTRTPDAQTLRDSGEKPRAKRPELKCQTPELKTPESRLLSRERSDTQTFRHSGGRPEGRS